MKTLKDKYSDILAPGSLIIQGKSSLPFKTLEISWKGKYKKIHQQGSFLVTMDKGDYILLSNS